MRARLGLVLIGLAALGACATQTMPAPGQDGGVDRAVGQPFRDLSVIREVAPPALLRAAEAPYDTAKVASCAAAQAEVADLNAALGPDISADARTNSFSVGGLAGDLMGGAIGIPFRGIVRYVTGAEERDQALRAAALAGMVRRGFLKGRMGVMGCPPPPEPQPPVKAAENRAAKPH
jgi:hypothetical protein